MAENASLEAGLFSGRGNPPARQRAFRLAQNICLQQVGVTPASESLS